MFSNNNVNKVKFFMPVRYEEPKTFKQHIQEGIEDYFYLGGKSAYVIPGKIVDNSQEVAIKHKDQSKIKQVILGAIKIISYMTVVIPLVMLAAKVVFRAIHKFHTTSTVNKVDRPTPQQQNTGTIADSFLKTPNPPLQSEMKDDMTASSTSKESEFVLSYYSNADQITFWDFYLESYNEAVNSNKWDSIQGLLFLNEEFQMIKGFLERLLHNVQSMSEQLRKKIIKNDSDVQQDLSSISDLKKLTDALLLKTKHSLDALQKKIQIKVDQDNQFKTSPKVRGLDNVGNTCYINSALQPLLAIMNFEELVPNITAPEPKYNFNERQAILTSFKIFLQAWKDKKPSPELGQRIGDLRRQIFAAGLLEGGFVHRHQERSFQDAGQFFELILHVLGRGFQLDMTRTPVMDDGTVIDNRKKIEQTPQGVFYLQSPGDSLQEIVNGHREALDQRFTPGNEWRIEHPETQKKMQLSRYKEMQKIAGVAPEILVVRVNNHVVKPKQDHLINFAALFKTPPENSDYELVGFSQNHSQIHWTSVVYDGSHWLHCNDNRVAQIMPVDSTFMHPANYMVYKKKA